MNRKWNIQRKFSVGFLLIFSISLLLLNIFISNMLNKNSENIIRAEMENMQQYSREYIKQHLLLKNLSGDVFADSGNILVQELSENLRTNVTLYDQEGIFLYETIGGKEYTIVNSKPSKLLEESSDHDLALALDNKAAYTINKMGNDWIVNFSYPLYINGEHYGIIRLTKDYSTLFLSNQKVLTSLTLFTLVLFIVIFLFSYILSRKITKPLSKVTEAFSEVAQGQFNTKLQINTGDEIEELNDRFHEMKDQIKEQIAVITAEKEKVEKLEKTRREFFNNVTHELKTPLTTISGYSQILSDEDFNDPTFLKKAAERIKKESDRLHQMVVEVIELSKQTVYEMKMLDVAQITKQLCEDMQMKATKYNMTITCKSKQPVFVKGVENRFLEVIINLLDNAIKYGENHSTIIVNSFQKSTDAFIQVSNTCESFNSSILDNAFDPFYRGSKTTKEEKGSSGLGLYICKQIIEEHGGSISIEEQNGVITFTISLPLWQ
ncbi:HAMP domain-containing sensor histidine kinase [Alkalihalobacterium elongatum]|uniref:HAMP domain-containing sensor histidine kinase n=1 Tax=Alkalihalobacterium elongatum TaxID=2675466 RepID=UPI001C1F21EB|nr:HAMP domain-containing sensor histidine kinase [Alkalihalobacterium elongatum]